MRISGKRAKCCRRRVRITLGRRAFCLSMVEARRVGRVAGMVVLKKGIRTCSKCGASGGISSVSTFFASVPKKNVQQFCEKCLRKAVYGGKVPSIILERISKRARSRS